MAQKEVTTLVIKVDLGYEKCRKKIKKVLCEIPQIQDQVYDEKKNTVTVKVVRCSPDKVKKKICCKGGKTIKGIEILKPPPPKPPTVKPPTIKPPPTVPKPKEPKTKPEVELVVEVEVEVEKPKRDPPAPPPPRPTVVEGYPPRGLCCMECYQGHGGGPCWGRPAAAGPCNECYGVYGRPVYDCWGGGGSYCYRGTYWYISDQNPSACSIM